MNNYFNVWHDMGPENGPTRQVRSRSGTILHLPPRWYLGKLLDSEGRTVSSDDYFSCRPAPLAPLRAAISYDGVPLDFTITGLNVPVVTRSVAELIDSTDPGSVQRIPITIEGHDGFYEVLNILNTVSCIDEAQSDLRKWTEADNRPDKIGQYKLVTDLVIDPIRAGSAHIFRPVGYTVALVISGALKDLLELHGVSGVKYRRLTR